jgi:hypothetical protein
MTAVSMDQSFTDILMKVGGGSTSAIYSNKLFVLFVRTRPTPNLHDSMPVQLLHTAISTDSRHLERVSKVNGQHPFS